MQWRNRVVSYLYIRLTQLSAGQGTIKNQYHHLRSYVVQLLDKKKNSIVIIKCVMGAKGHIFERMHMCIEACKVAFATTCRPLIGLDGFFLKGNYLGHLLTIMGKDDNNQILPIAYALVVSESTKSWSWFLGLLLVDLNGTQRNEWTFICNQ